MYHFYNFSIRVVCLTQLLRHRISYMEIVSTREPLQGLPRKNVMVQMLHNQLRTKRGSSGEQYEDTVKGIVG